MILGPTKSCSQCKLVYLATLEFFGPDKKKRLGLSSWCRKCNRHMQREYARKWRAKQAELGRDLYRDVQWKSKLKRLYGLTEEQHAAMLERQGGLCAICQKPMTKVCVDHCHATGVVRGLLCWTCNTGLGAFCDSPKSLRRAIDYLNEYSQATAV